MIGLTGTIGAGKSTVMRWLAAYGAWTVDADQVVRRLYTSDRTLQAALQARFGSEVVRGGSVDRAALARVVFGGQGSASQPNTTAMRASDRSALAELEAIVHPAVHAAEDQELARARAAGAPACVLEAIRLVESGGSARCDELWIVVAVERVQLARLAARGVAEDEARRRLAAQGSVATWVAAFTAESARIGRARPIVVVDNSGDEDAGRAQVERLWRGIAPDAMRRPRE